MTPELAVEGDVATIRMSTAQMRLMLTEARDGCSVQAIHDILRRGAAPRQDLRDLRPALDHLLGRLSAADPLGDVLG